MKIAQGIDSYYPHIDGVTRVVDNYARIMQQHGDDVQVFTPRVHKYKDATPYKVNRAPSISILTDISLPVPYINKKTQRDFDALKPEILHLHSPVVLSRYLARLAHKRGIPVAITFHSKYYDDFYTYSHSRLIARLATKSIVKFYNTCDSVWACSNRTADTLRSYGYKGAITVMPNAADIGIHYPENDEEKNKLIKLADEAYGVMPQGLHIIFVGQSIWQKNQRFVLDTCAVLKKRGIPFTLLNIGRGEHEKKIHAYANKLGLTDCVRFLGKVSDKLVLQGLYLRSDVMFFPSVYDNCPLVVQEASLNRIPSVLMDGSNAAEGVVHGENGYLCSNLPEYCADLLTDIYNNPDKARQAGIKASQTLVNSWYDIVDKTRAEYERIIKRGMIQHND